MARGPEAKGEKKGNKPPIRFVPELWPKEKDPSYDRFAQEVLDSMVDSSVESQADRPRKTIIDLKRIPAESTDDQILGWAAVALHLPVESLKEGSPVTYQLLNEGLADAKEYFVALHAERYLPESFPIVRNAEELVALVRKSAQVNSKTGLPPSEDGVKHCAMICAAIAGIEARQKKVANLIGEVEYVGQQLGRPSKDGTQFLHFLLGKKGKAATEQVDEKQARRAFSLFPRADSKSTRAIRGTVEWRAKQKLSIMTKFLERQDASGETAFKDGIAMRFTVAPTDMAQVGKNLALWLTTNFSAQGLKFENANAFSAAGWEELKEKIAHESLKVTFADSHKGSGISQGTYTAFKLVGRIFVPVAGNRTGELEPRAFEVQIIPEGVHNERKGLSHDIYEVVKKVSVMTRLFGACPEDIFQKYVEEAARLSRLEVKNVHELLNTDGRVHKFDKMVANPKVWDEWLEAGMPGVAAERRFYKSILDRRKKKA